MDHMDLTTWQLDNLSQRVFYRDTYHYSTKQGVINIAIQKALRGEKLSIWGDGTGCKDYIYIEDFCRILFILINMNYKNEIVNIGSGSVYSLNDIVETIHKQLPSFGWEYTCCHQSDVVDFTLDISKLLSIIGDMSIAREIKDLSFFSTLISQNHWTFFILTQMFKISSQTKYNNIIMIWKNILIHPKHSLNHLMIYN